MLLAGLWRRALIDLAIIGLVAVMDLVMVLADMRQQLACRERGRPQTGPRPEKGSEGDDEPRCRTGVAHTRYIAREGSIES